MAPHRDLQQPLDHALLTAQTLGDAELEAELFTLFETQCVRLWPVIAGPGDGTSRAEAAHTLKGGAAAVGAIGVMRLAGELETSLASGQEEKSLARLLADLGHAIGETRAAIARLRAGA